jgi:hypothetical protein
VAVAVPIVVVVLRRAEDVHTEQRSSKSP